MANCRFEFKVPVILLFQYECNKFNGVLQNKFIYTFQRAGQETVKAKGKKYYTKYFQGGKG